MKYGFIGCGNMGSALALSLSKAENNIALSDFISEKAEKLAEEIGARPADNSFIAQNCEYIFLGVKPQVLADTLLGIKDILSKTRPILITMAAGVSIAKIEGILGFRLPIIRIMPNTPVSVGEGMILYCNNDLVKEKILSEFVNNMRFSGTLDSIPEDLIDAGCSLSGCGPAFMFMFAEYLALGAVNCGLSEDKAIKYAAATMLGSAKLLLSSEKNARQLREAVCSKGGSTIKGVEVFDEGNLKGLCENAVKAAYKRNIELGK